MERTLIFSFNIGIEHMLDFGKYFREKREALSKKGKSLSLRYVSKEIGVDPGYLSKIERGVFAPPSESLIIKMAEIIDEDKDVLLALAGKVSSDLHIIIKKRPKLFGQLIRQLKDAPDNAIFSLVREVQDGEW